MRNLTLLGLILVLFVSCKKEETTTPIENPQVLFSYLPMKVGNYWVYRHYNIDTIGNIIETAETPITDSVVITGTTIINGNRYFVFEGTNYPITPGWGVIDLLRDSSGYIVNAQGIIKFSKDNFTDTLAFNTTIINNDTIYRLSYKMEDPDTIVTVPAGNFSVLNYRGTVQTKMNIPGIPNPRYINTFYADNVGCILDTYFFLSNATISEKRLIRFKADEE
jgi:hypothetical protein